MKMNMKKKNLLYTLGMALLFAAAFPACTQSDDEPGGRQPEGKILLTPTVGVEGLNGGGAVTRAEQKIAVTLAEGGKISVTLLKDGAPAGCNFFAVDAAGKLSRIAYDPQNPEGDEDPLNIEEPGEYGYSVTGDVVCTAQRTDGNQLRFTASIGSTSGATVTIAADGKVSFPCKLTTSAVCLNLTNPDGTAYDGVDVIATLTAGISGYTPDPVTIATAAPYTMWGDIPAGNTMNAGATLLQLAVGDKTYEVKAPRNLTFTAGRMVVFNVRVGATGIVVGDITIGDFGSGSSSSVTAGIDAVYDGQSATLVAHSGGADYWVAPVDLMERSPWAQLTAQSCPKGWNIPTRLDFETMMGSNTNYCQDIMAAFGATTDARYAIWTTTENDASTAYVFKIEDGGNGRVVIESKVNSYIVRCVRKK